MATTILSSKVPSDETSSSIVYNLLYIIFCLSSSQVFMMFPASILSAAMIAERNLKNNYQQLNTKHR